MLAIWSGGSAIALHDATTTSPIAVGSSVHEPPGKVPSGGSDVKVPGNHKGTAASGSREVHALIAGWLTAEC